MVTAYTSLLRNLEPLFDSSHNTSSFQVLRNHLDNSSVNRPSRRGNIVIPRWVFELLNSDTGCDSFLIHSQYWRSTSLGVVLSMFLQHADACYFFTFVADDVALLLNAREGVCGLRPFSPLPREGVFLWEPVGVVEGGGPSGSVVGVGLSARRLETVFTPPNKETTNI